MKAESTLASATARSAAPAEVQPLIVRHLRFGWWSLLLFLSFGITLEILHGLKAGLYLNVSSETRRLMWTLAHAHGTMLALVHIAFTATLPFTPGWPERLRGIASGCLMAASVLLPGGFFLGGLITHGGDPGLGILLVPVGALALFTAVLLTARGLKSKL